MTDEEFFPEKIFFPLRLHFHRRQADLPEWNTGLSNITPAVPPGVVGIFDRRFCYATEPAR